MTFNTAISPSEDKVPHSVTECKQTLGNSINNAQLQWALSRNRHYKVEDGPREKGD